jgi:hypothetical protein
MKNKIIKKVVFFFDQALWFLRGKSLQGFGVTAGRAVAKEI